MKRHLELKGVALLLVLAALVAFSIATYEKAFQAAVHVEVTVPRAGLQLNQNGDVRLKGALVGRISSVRQVGDHAVIGLALDPAAAQGIPDDSVIRILPTTLFGQKYVELVRPVDSTARAVRDGDVLHEDSGASAIEIGALLDRLEPVLTAVRPHDLAVTLDALATGLNGRGEEIGALATNTRALLADFDRHLPQLIRDLRLLADVTTTYADLAPDLLRLLANLTVSGRTVTDRRLALAALLVDVTDFAHLGTGWLERNTPALAEIVRDSRPVARVLQTYSPEFGCLLAGLLVAEKAVEGPFDAQGIFQVHMTLGSQAKGYTAKDREVLGDVGRGPHCAGLPVSPTPVPAFTSANDGVG